MARTPFSRELPALDFSTPSKRDTMDALRELIEAGRLTPVVDRTFPLERGPRGDPPPGVGAAPAGGW